jgi:hypothetical protein
MVSGRFVFLVRSRAFSTAHLVKIQVAEQERKLLTFRSAVVPQPLQSEDPFV